MVMTGKQITALIAWAVIMAGAIPAWMYVRKKYGTMRLYPVRLVLVTAVWFWMIFGTDFFL